MSDVNSTVEYRNIPGFPGYQAGSDGTVWSCWKKVGLGWGKGTTRIMANQWTELKRQPNKNGYRYVTLRRNKTSHVFTVHHLILFTFVGPCPPGMECRHFPDRNPLNNRLENLRYGTPKENMDDQRTHGTRVQGDTHPGTKVSEADIEVILAIAATNPKWGYQKHLAIRFGVSQSVISGIINGKVRKRLY